MPVQIACPTCGKQLRVPEELLGKQVRCPGCSNAFTAQAGGGVEAAPPVQMSAPPPGDEGEEEVRPSRRESRVRASAGADVKAHRGLMDLLLGIGGIILSLPTCCPPVGLILAIVAFILSKNDLAAMDAGTMDPAGRGQTKGGWMCGIVGMVLGILGLLCWCGGGIWQGVAGNR